MNIAFDAGAIEVGRGSGIGNYTLNQFQSLVRRTPENQYFYFNIVEDSSLVDCIKEDNFHKCFFYAGKGALIRNYGGRYQEIYGEIVKAFIRKFQIDVFYITSPFFSENALYQKEWFEGVAVVATAWDIIPYVMRKEYLNDSAVFNWYMSCISMLRWTDRQLAISNSVKEDMVRYLGFDPDKIDVIYGGVSERFREIVINEDEKVALLRKFGIRKEFVLCCVSADTRKNVEGAIKAFAKLSPKLADSYQMVIVGRILPEKKKSFTALISSLNMGGRVILTDYVTDEELLALYNLAKLMVFPSLYEGFGLPALEAWACGTPVIASRNSSLGEIVGDAGILFDPSNTNDIAKAMEEALTTADLAALLAKGKEKVKKFTWDWVAELTENAICTALTQKQPPQPQGKIALVYPPDSLGEAWNKIPELLDKYFQIDVYADHMTQISDRLWAIFRVEELAQRKEIYDWVVFISPDLTIQPNCKGMFAKGKMVWLVAEEYMENLLRLAFEMEALDNNALSDAGILRLSRYFTAECPKCGIDAFDKIVTASQKQREALSELSLAQPVYLVNPTAGCEIGCSYNPGAMVSALAENLCTAIRDVKPWGAGKEWGNGEQLLEEFMTSVMTKENYSIHEKECFAHTLGYAFSGEPRRLLRNGDATEFPKISKGLRVDFVSSWNTQCGIAEFTRFYYETIQNQVDIHVYPNIAEELVRTDEPFVQGRFWQFHLHPNNLLCELLRSDAKIVHIQYTEGFFRTEDLVALLEGLHVKKQIVITCHNTAFLIPTTEKQRQILNTAYYVVHQEKDWQQLKNNGILEERLRLIAHGQVTFPTVDREEIRKNLGIGSRKPVVGSYGFLFAHKGVLETIKAVSLLKKNYPDILYIPCCAIRSDVPDSKQYYDRCQDEVRNLGLESNVIMVSDFLEAKESAYILQLCDVTVMAYGNTQESASGAVRFCIAVQRPILTTKQPIFAELSDCSLQIVDNTPQQIAKGIDALMRPENMRKYTDALSMKKKAASWEKVSQDYLELYRVLLRNYESV